MSDRSTLCVSTDISHQQSAVEALAAKLDLPICNGNPVEPGIMLYLGVERLELRQLGKGAPGPAYVDFLTGKVSHRRQYGGGRGQPLARAVGLKGGATPTIIDTTAGLGRDAFVLATLGCTVQMVERSAVIASLLADGLMRAREDGEIGPIIQRMQLHNADGRSFLDTLEPAGFPDVVYLDPMYPHRQKSAKVKKEMRLFQQLIGSDPDSHELLASARRVARRRVVVKRPVKSEPLGDQRPGLSISSPNTRYDVYLAQR